MILGLDVSTTTIGIAVLNENEEILLSEALSLKKESCIENKGILFEKKLKEIKKDYNISQIVIEKPFAAFGKSTAHTIAILNCFNGICRYVSRKVFNIIPTLVDPRSARSLFGIQNVKKAKNKHAKKEPIIKFVYEKYKDSSTPFEYELTRHGNPSGGVDDKCDAIILALYGKKNL